MRKHPLLLLPLVAAWLTTGGCKQGFETLGVSVEVEQHRLKNGLRVVLVEDHTVPIISYHTFFRVGSVDETPGRSGLAHFFEHLMFKGTPKHGPKEFFQKLEARGAEVNAFTARDYTAYHETFTPELLPDVIELESDRLANLSLGEEHIRVERNVVLEEGRREVESSPTGRMQEALWALAYRVHPYRNPIRGFPEDVAGLTAERAREWFSRYYQPGNATLVLVGDFQAGPTLARIRKAYEAIPGRPVKKRELPTEPEQREERRLILRDHVAAERLAQAYHVPSAHDDEAYAVDVLANILFAGESSRAYRRLVEEKEIAISTGGSAYTPAYPGLFIISTLMKAGVPATQAESELDGVIREVQERGVTDEEVRRAVRQLSVQLVDGVRTPHGLAQFIGTVSMIFDDPSKFADDLQKYLRVQPADVQAAAQKFLLPNNRTVIILLPEGQRK